MFISPIKKYDSPENLAAVSRSPVKACAIIFAAAGGSRREIERIRSNSQLRELIRKRHAITYVAMIRNGITPCKLARAMNRDHSTILHSKAQSKILHRGDPEFRALCKRIEVESDG